MINQIEAEAIAKRWDYQWLRKMNQSHTKFEIEHEIPVVYLAGDGSEDRLAREICQILLRDLPDDPFVACVNSEDTWFIRGRDAATVQAIAEAFDGSVESEAIFTTGSSVR